MLRCRGYSRILIHVSKTYRESPAKVTMKLQDIFSLQISWLRIRIIAFFFPEIIETEFHICKSSPDI